MATSSKQSDTVPLGVMKIIEEIYRDAHGEKYMPKSEPKNYLRENIRDLRKTQHLINDEKARTERLCSRKPTNPYSHISAKVITHAKRQYSKENAQLMQRANSASAHSSCVPSDVHGLVTPHPLGFVPDFIRKWKIGDAERKKALEKEKDKPAIPFGHILISEEDRATTLDLLHQKKDLLWIMINKLPLTYETRRRIQYKEELENSLIKVEEGIKLFSRKIVFVKAY